MNILFLLRYLNAGGLEIVSSVLANKFVSEEHHVSVFAFEKRTGRLLDRLDSRVKVVVGGTYRKTPITVAELRRLLIDQKIEVVINQWGLPTIPIRTLLKAKEGLPVKIISVYHNDPLQNGRIQRTSLEIIQTVNLFRKLTLCIKKKVYRYITGYSMRYIYNQSDYFEVLSPSYISHFQKFAMLRNTPKLLVQTNPITIDVSGFEYDSEKKKKEIIFVGRLDYSQKRAFRLVEVWSQLEYLFPDWVLTIVGDGPEADDLKQMARNLELERINFKGFQHPRPYYERASILILTSEFEGFPLVLAECMSFGVVPVVYGSFSAVYDIIEDGKDGIVIPKTDESFNARLMAEEIRKLMSFSYSGHIREMALAAIEKSKNFSIDTIYSQWINNLNNLIQ